jgi:hypothetical protein
MWTQNTESLRANWYHTNRGTQQVVADWLAPGNYPDGYIASRLNKASLGFAAMIYILSVQRQYNGSRILSHIWP